MSDTPDALLGDDEQRLMFEEIKRVEGNETCADCNAKNPCWAVVNAGVFVCVRCVGHHRSLGTSISVPRSISLDRWKKSDVEGMRGNAAVRPCLLFFHTNFLVMSGHFWIKVNRDLEFSLSCAKPVQDSSAEYSGKFISEKYAKRAFTKEVKGGERLSVAWDKPTKGTTEWQQGYQGGSGILFITLLRGDNLIAKDLNGKSDPYVKIFSDTQQAKSKTVMKSLSPDFGREQLSLTIQSVTAPVRVEVWDYDRITADDLMGQGELIPQKHLLS